MANRAQLQAALHKPYDRILFAKEVLSLVFGSCFSLSSLPVLSSVQPNKSEQAVIDTVSIYGIVTLEDNTEITCYEIVLQPKVRIEQSKVAIQRYVRKLLTAGQAALVNFVAPQNKNVWRLTLVAKDSELTDEGIKEKTTHAKRYTYLLGPNESCKTAADRFETLSIGDINFDALVKAFSVEKLSKAFFEEYTLHYEKFISYLNASAYKKSVFKSDEKAIRDFTKKLLGRIIFLYFVQKKGWLGATDTNYKDGRIEFMKLLFKSSGGDETFYSNWLTVLFFETLNQERANDVFKMPDGKNLKVPFLNGGLFDKEEHDEHVLTFKAKLFHNPDNEDVILSKSNGANARGFLDFLDAFNFTVYEDSPDDHTVAVDPEMLGHIFENLLEDNKDKGAFYTPKEIVHYMCQESLIEYLSTHLSKEYTVYRQLDNKQIELFGNDSRKGQLKMIEQLGDNALNHGDVEYIVKQKDISNLSTQQLKRIDELLDTVKICDPAIGSGAFPMGLLQEIHVIKEVIAYELGNEWKPADVKENIIQNSIYGVDIEKGAVDIARLRFWLSLVVDEDQPRALPNLDYKIVVGDSLISKFGNEIVEIEWDRKKHTSGSKEYIENIEKLLKEIAKKQRQFFKPENKDKKKLNGEIRNLKLELLINQLSLNRDRYRASNIEKGGFAPTAADIKFNTELKLVLKNFENLIIKLQGLKKEKDKPFVHFDWKLDFPEILNPYLVNDNAGFDIVIGNPPYISYYGNTGSDLSLETRKYIAATFESVRKENDRINSMNLFSEKGLKLLKPKGHLAFIVNKTMAVLPSYYHFRDYYLNNVRFNYIITDLTPFEAIVDCFIFGITRDKTESEYNFKFFKGEITSYRLENVSTFRKNRKIEFHVPQNDSLLGLIEKAPNKLSEILTINRGVNIGGCFENFLSPRKENNKYQKYLSGTKCIKPYYWEWTIEDGYMIFDTKEEKLLRTKGKTLALGNHDRYLQPRLFIPESAQSLMAAYAEETVYSAYGLLVGTSDLGKKYLKYACGLLNSKLFTFYAIQKEILRKGNKATPHVGVKGLNSIPIYPCHKDSEVLEVFSCIVDYLTFIKEKKTSQDYSFFERLIDLMVYELYFPEIIKGAGAEVLKYLNNIEGLKPGEDENNLKAIDKAYRQLLAPQHPVNAALLKLLNVEEIAIIEGRNETNSIHSN